VTSFAALPALRVVAAVVTVVAAVAVATVAIAGVSVDWRVLTLLAHVTVPFQLARATAVARSPGSDAATISLSNGRV